MARFVVELTLSLRGLVKGSSNEEVEQAVRAMLESPVMSDIVFPDDYVVTVFDVHADDIDLPIPEMLELHACQDWHTTALHGELVPDIEADAEDPDERRTYAED